MKVSPLGNFAAKPVYGDKSSRTSTLMSEARLTRQNVPDQEHASEGFRL
jgi:hypothetical protein